MTPRLVPMAVATALRVAGSHRFWQAAVVFACVYLSCVLFWLLPGTPVLMLDTAAYLSLDARISLGYPAFVHGVEAVTGSLRWVPAVQLIVFIGAVLYLHEAAARLFRRPAIAGLLALSLLAYGPVTGVLVWLLPEPLFIALILVAIGAVFHALGCPGANLPLYVLAASAAIIIFVRPAGYFVPGAVLFLALAWRGQFRRLAIRALVPMLVLVMLAMGGGYMIRGIFTQAIDGSALFPHVANLFEAGFVAPGDRDMAVAIETVTQAYARRLAARPDWRARYRVAVDEFNPLLDAIRDKIREKWVDAGVLPSSRREQVERFNEELRDLSVTTILHRPLGYLEVLLLNVAGAWDMCIMAPYPPVPTLLLGNFRLTEPTARLVIERTGANLAPYDIDAWIEQYPVLKRQSLPFVDTTSNLLNGERPLIWGIGVVSLLAVPVTLFLRRASPSWVAFAFVGAMLHGSVFLTAAATVFIQRYALPVDAIVIIALLLACDIGLAGLERLGTAQLARIRQMPVQPFSNRSLKNVSETEMRW
jgi:hypothetical protein